MASLISNEEDEEKFNFDELLETIQASNLKSFDEYLEEFYNELKNPPVETVSFPNPQLIKEHNKSVWMNVKAYLSIVKRDPKHFLAFANSFLDYPIQQKTSRLRDGVNLDNRNVKKKDIINLMVSYTNKFVKCPSCNSCKKTKLTKHETIRKAWNFKCKICFSTQIIT